MQAFIYCIVNDMIVIFITFNFRCRGEVLQSVNDDNL